MQVLKLAGRALEDQVSKSGHAQVGATLQKEGGTGAQATCSETLGWLPCLAQIWYCPSQNTFHKVRAVHTSDPGPCPLPQAAGSRAPACTTMLGTGAVCCPLTSSSQYFRITSRALSVISGASSTTLVKILPEREGRDSCRGPPGLPGSPACYRLQGNRAGFKCGRLVTYAETLPL